jgi:hypothetical protein
VRWRDDRTAAAAGLVPGLGGLQLLIQHVSERGGEIGIAEDSGLESFRASPCKLDMSGYHHR